MFSFPCYGISQTRALAAPAPYPRHRALADGGKRIWELAGDRSAEGLRSWPVDKLTR
jgi:hypothetical protein